MKKRPRIGLIVETTFSAGREILRGISKYLVEHDPWSLFLGPIQLDQSLPRWLEKWNGDGIIARVSNAEVLHTIKNAGLPLVDVLGEIENTGIPLVEVNNRKVAELAFRHLSERGYRDFAFVGVTDYNWSIVREQTFQQLAQQADCQCRIIRLGNRLSQTPWDVEQELLVDWLLNLPKPCGLMACNDGQGLQVLEACARADISVPEEVAVIGVDNDQLICDLSIPALSSIDPGHFFMGYQAAETMSRMLAGETVPELLQIETMDCIVRESTDIAAVNDPVLANALAFIRQNACHNITTQDIANHVIVSVSTLKRRFAAHSTHSINRCILNAKLDRAMRLLRDTDLSIEQIAYLAGYTDATYFSTSFRKEIGNTPKDYRKLHRKS